MDSFTKAFEKVKLNKIWKQYFKINLFGYKDFSIIWFVYYQKKWNQEYCVNATFDKKALDFLLSYNFSLIYFPMNEESINSVNWYRLWIEMIKEKFSHLDLSKYWFIKNLEESEILSEVDVFQYIEESLTINKYFSKKTSFNPLRDIDKMLVDIKYGDELYHKRYNYNKNKIYLALDKINEKINTIRFEKSFQTLPDEYIYPVKKSEQDDFSTLLLNNGFVYLQNIPSNFKHFEEDFLYNLKESYCFLYEKIPTFHWQFNKNGSFILYIWKFIENEWFVLNKLSYNEGNLTGRWFWTFLMRRDNILNFIKNIKNIKQFNEIVYFDEKKKNKFISELKNNDFIYESSFNSYIKKEKGTNYDFSIEYYEDENQFYIINWYESTKIYPKSFEELMKFVYLLNWSYRTNVKKEEINFDKYSEDILNDFIINKKFYKYIENPLHPKSLKFTSPIWFWNLIMDVNFISFNDSIFLIDDTILQIQFYNTMNPEIKNVMSVYRDVIITCWEDIYLLFSIFWYWDEF